MKTFFSLLLVLSLPLSAQESAQREYTNIKGKKLTASIVGFDGDKVGFIIKDGKVSYYPIKQLSQADQEYLAKHPLRVLPKVNYDFEAPFGIYNEKDELIYIDRDGKVKFKPKFTHKKQYLGSYVNVVLQSGDNAVVDVNGKTVMRSKGQWNIRGDYTDDLILVSHSSTGEYAFMDQSSKIRIDFKYKQAHRMMDEVAWVNTEAPGVKTQKPWILINSKGEEIYTLPKGASLIDRTFDSGFCRVKIDHEIVYLDTKGKQSLDKEIYKSASAPFREGYAILNNGILNNEGKWTLSAKAGYSMVSQHVTEGVAIAKKGRHYYILAAKNGQELAELPFGYRPEKSGSRCGLICFSDNSDPRKYGYMDRTGKIVIKPQYILGSYFVNGYASVRLADYKSRVVISTLGKTVYTEKSNKSK